MSSIASPIPAPWSMARTPNEARVAIAVMPRPPEERGHPVGGESARTGGEREQAEQQHRRLGADQLTDETRDRRLPQRAQRGVAERDRRDDRDEPPPDADVRAETGNGHARERRAAGDQADRDDETGGPAGTLVATRPTHRRSGNTPSVPQRPRTTRADAERDGTRRSDQRPKRPREVGAPRRPVEQREPVTTAAMPTLPSMRCSNDETAPRGLVLTSAPSATRQTSSSCERDEQRGHLAFRGDRFRCGRRDENQRVERARPRRDAPHRRIADQARAQRRDAGEDRDEQGKAVDDEPSVPHRDRDAGPHTAQAEQHQSACGQ